MINAFDFWDRGLKFGRLSTILGFSGEAFCDSGGYQVLTRREQVTAEQVIVLQRSLGTSLNAVLDNANDHKQHLRNFETYLAHSENAPRFPFVPVVPHDLPKRWIRRMVELHPNPAIIAIGKVVPSLFPLTDQRKLLSVLRHIQVIKESFPASRIHVFGLGGITTAALFFYLIDSTDSSSWVHDARFGKMRTIGGGIARTTRPASIERFLQQQQTCGCPVCDEHKEQVVTGRGIAGTRLRALHNAWVTVREMELLNQSLSDGSYDELVERRARRSGWHLSLLRAVKGFVN